jgi:predicted site-specific integrase-resolvase
VQKSGAKVTTIFGYVRALPDVEDLTSQLKFRPSASNSFRARRRAPGPSTRRLGSVRAALYLRVSTTRQAEVDLSIPDQQAQTSAYCARRDWRIVAEYVEPGASAMDDHRPEFQRMIERACDDDRPIDMIVVHSFSRFFRDAFGLEMYVRKLAKHGVRLVSITQELGDDPAQVMMRQVIV